MHKIVISDTSTLIIFQKIDEFNLLKNVYHEIMTTPEVADEFGQELPAWIKIQKVHDSKYQSLLELQVDKGEASALALASEFDNVLLLPDDLKARKLAKKMQFNFTGTLGIIQKAKKMNLIDRIKPIIEKIRNTNSRINDNIVHELLVLNNESAETKE